MIGDALTRFMAKVEFDPFGGCWLWSGALCGLTHPHFQFEGQVQRAHHVSLLMFRGVSVPPGLLVRHLCNVSVCVHPLHLEPGTSAENSRDAMRAGTHIALTNRKLTLADLAQARSLRDAGATYRSLGAGFGVHHETIRKALCGLTWSETL